MINCLKENVSPNIFHIHRNPFKIKRNYNTMLQFQIIKLPVFTPVNTNFKTLKVNSDLKPNESLIKKYKPKIPEKFLREIEIYKSQLNEYNY